MKRRHVAIFTNLGNGHVYPTLGLCSELANRGYRVTYVTNDYYAHRIRETGAEPVIFSPAEFEGLEEIRKSLGELPIRDPNWWRIIASSVYPWFLNDATATLPQVEGFYNENTPDVILYDRLAFAGRILAKRLNSPAIQLSFVFAPYQNYLIRQNGVCLTPEPMLEFSKLLDSFLSSHGIDERENLFHIADLNIYFIPKAFQHHADWFDKRFCFVGPCLNRPFRSTWRNNSGKPILLISGLSDGADSGYFRILIDALSGSQYHVILSIGKHITPSSLGEHPPNCEINQHTYHLEMLPHTALTICQAGMGTTLESIYHGVPVISIPVEPSEEDNAYRVAELGLGTHLPRATMTVGTVMDNVESVLGDTSLLGRVKRMQQVFRDCGGAQMAADSIAEFLGIGRSI